MTLGKMHAQRTASLRVYCAKPVLRPKGSLTPFPAIEIASHRSQ